jgi:hypothetical protein
MATGHYFRSPEKWTLDRDEAYDFGVASRAMKVAHKLRIRDLELELSFDDPEPPPATPFQRFVRGLSRNGRRPVNGNEASRQAALA